MTNRSRARLIALDWGTTSCRAFLLGDGGAILAERRQKSGVMVVATAADLAGVGHAEAFEESFEALCGEWLSTWPDLPVIACGMVGSNRGWAETPYRHLPADLAAEGLVLTSVSTGRTTINIVPGLIDESGMPDVIRGEETQVLGALMDDHPDEGALGIDQVVLLPGTHSKWVRVSGTTVTGFTTCMTGELFAFLAMESTLSLQSMPPTGVDWAAFERGLEVAAAPEGKGGILTTAFSARTLVMTGGLRPTQVEDYLSGLLIGSEVAGIAASWLGELPGEIVLCGEAGLNERYRRALSRFGLSVARETTTSAAGGMWGTAVAAGLLVDTDEPPSESRSESPRKSPSNQRARAMKSPAESITTYPGLIAILRGLPADDAVDVGECLYDAGFRSLEVPFNSPDPLATIRALRKSLPADCLVGAGTVLTVDQVRDCHDAGGQIVVSPNTDTAVIAETVRLGMQSFPGAASPSDAFAAIGAGAKNVKIFPSEQVGINGLKAWTAVVPKEINLIPVGGIDAANMDIWMTAGATGFGIGSSLYKPGIAVEDLRQRAVALMAAWNSALASTRKSA